LNAVVLAGGAPDAVAALDPQAVNKAFVRIAGEPLVARTSAALRTAPGIERIVVVAPRAAHADAALGLADEVRPDGPHIGDSLRSGLAGFAPDELVLVSAADLPVLSRESLDEFIELATAANADLVYACVERRVHEAHFPEVPHTWAHFREGTFCGGGCFAIRPRVFPALERFLDRLGNARKNPLALAAIFGYDVLARYALRRLPIAAAERRAAGVLGAPVRAAVCSRPEIAVNVDRPSDVALAERLLASASSGV
jgi:molybdopterin-guanine dinucleotide biosynthesis protein A